LEVDPGFDLSAWDSATRDPAVIWERYRPTAPQVLALGAPYDGLDWPGTQGVNYRGALPGSQDPQTFLPFLGDSLQASSEVVPANDASGACY
jgi:hypothetical protein